MCQFQHLCFDDNGYVIRCKVCGHYQIGFGTLVITVPEQEYLPFHEMAFSLLNKPAEAVGEHQKSLVLATPFEGVRMLLSRHELQSFTDLLLKADAEEQALALLQLFEAC